MTVVTCDVVIIGASLGGVAAALASARNGRNTVLVSASNWVGGQMTSQGVCTPDENQYVETTGSTSSYRDFRQRTRQYYENTYTLSAAGNSAVASAGHLNLGESWVSLGYSVEATVGDTILKQMLSELNVNLMLSVTVTDAMLSADGNSVTGITATASDGTALQFTATYYLDATDLGDVLPMANVEHFLGAESQPQTGEPDAPSDGPHRDWIQPFTYPIALQREPEGQDYTIAEPANYAAIRDAQSFTLVDGNINGMFVARPLPNNQGQGLVFWTYRRVVDAALFAPGTFAGDISNINTASNDYLAQVVPTGDTTQDAATLAAGRQVSLCYIYWLQTECPRDPGDGSGTGYPNLRPMTEFWNTPDAIAPDPYVREGRRIQALTTILEQDIVAEDASGHDLQAGPRARLYPDSCGIGSYAMDVHANGLGESDLFLSTWNFQIPLGALVPVRVSNLLPACKNLGVTHLTNGAYRLHPIEWNVGEAAGALAAFCIAQSSTPQAVAKDTTLVTQFQTNLLGDGVPIFWWTDVPDTDPSFLAIQLLGAQGIFSGTTGLDFDPTGIVTAAEQTALAERIAPRTVTWPDTPITRAQAAQLLLG